MTKISAKATKTANTTLFSLMTAGSVILGTTCAATPAHADPGASRPCLWAGTGFEPGASVYAGGWAFTCRADNLGSTWTRSPAPGHASTVVNPGADDYSATGFSTGAWQPGTSFFDYCIADSVMPGSDYIFEAVPYRGSIFWRSTASITQWTIDPTARQYNWHPERMCVDGALS